MFENFLDFCHFRIEQNGFPEYPIVCENERDRVRGGVPLLYF